MHKNIYSTVIVQGFLVGLSRGGVGNKFCMACDWLSKLQLRCVDVCAIEDSHGAGRGCVLGHTPGADLLLPGLVCVLGASDNRRFVADFPGCVVFLVGLISLFGDRFRRVELCQ